MDENTPRKPLVLITSENQNFPSTFIKPLSYANELTKTHTD